MECIYDNVTWEKVDKVINMGAPLLKTGQKLAKHCFHDLPNCLTEAGSETPGTGSESSGAGSETPGAGSETPGAGSETPGAGS